jgi:hypothetical protein
VLALLRFPFDLVRALADGVAMGLEVCYPMAKPPAPEGMKPGYLWGYLEPHLARAGAELLAEAEAEREAWDENELRTEAEWLGYQTASTDGAVTADPAVECSPAAAASATSAAAGHPNRNQMRMRVAVAGLRQWVAGETCSAPTYFGCIADDLEQLAK